MKQLASTLRRVWEKLGGLFTASPPVRRRAVVKSAELEPETTETERLDRLRNPGDYRGR